eukprot:scaffold119710_cov63-Phaeocystis_antarctica.AAC.1
MSTSHRAKRESILGRKSFQSLPAGTQRPDAHAMPALYNACEMVAAWSMPGPTPCASVPLRVPVAYETQTWGYHLDHGRSISDWITRWTSFDCFVVTPGASAARRDTAIGSIRTLPVVVLSTESFAIFSAATFSAATFSAAAFSAAAFSAPAFSAATFSPAAFSAATFSAADFSAAAAAAATWGG